MAEKKPAKTQTKTPTKKQFMEYAKEGEPEEAGEELAGTAQKQADTPGPHTSHNSADQ